MNSLSWLLYLADIVGNIQGLLGFVAFIGGISLVFMAIFFGIEDDSFERVGRILRRYLWLPIVAAFLATVIPSTNALYLIAASEAGETVVTSPDTIEMMGDLKAIIKKRLKEELGE
jgi:hypothetical protein